MNCVPENERETSNVRERKSSEKCILCNKTKNVRFFKQKSNFDYIIMLILKIFYMERHTHTHTKLIQSFNKIPWTNLLQLNCKLKSLFHTFDSIILSSLYILIPVLINFSTFCSSSTPNTFPFRTPQYIIIIILLITQYMATKYTNEKKNSEQKIHSYKFLLLLLYFVCFHLLFRLIKLYYVMRKMTHG